MFKVKINGKYARMKLKFKILSTCTSLCIFFYLTRKFVQ
jgi:hypothetical protein